MVPKRYHFGTTLVPWTLMEQHSLKPFGAEIRATSSQSDVSAIDVDELQQAIATHRLCVLRGFRDLQSEEILTFCRRFGKVRQRQSGKIVDLKIQHERKNFLYTNGEVPFHWDGAFASSAPRYIFLYCVEAPESEAGGETIFCDAGLIVTNAPEELRNQWKQTTITYTPDGPDSFNSPLITEHPVSGIPVLRYAEPIYGLNAMSVSIAGLSKEETESFLSDIHSLLHNPDFWYVHFWRKGDILIADNHALLHARKAFPPESSRHLTKVNIL